MASPPLQIPTGFDGLTPDEKVEFIEALWERAAHEIGVSPAQLREVRRRQAMFNSDAVSVPAPSVASVNLVGSVLEFREPTAPVASDDWFSTE